MKETLVMLGEILFLPIKCKVVGPVVRTIQNIEWLRDEKEKEDFLYFCSGCLLFSDRLEPANYKEQDRKEEINCYEPCNTDNQCLMEEITSDGDTVWLGRTTSSDLALVGKELLR